jgi:hypothetical protein
MNANITRMDAFAQKKASELKICFVILMKSKPKQRKTMMRKNEKVLGTTASIRGKALQVLKELGADDHHAQFRVICKCRGLADANRKCEALGLGYNLFHRDYCTETGVQHEIDLCEKEDVWIRIGNNGSYYSAVDVVGKAKSEV